MSAPAIISSGTAAGGPPVGGSGTVGTLPIWVGASTLGNSAVTQVSGSIFSLTGLVGGAGYAATSTAIVALGGGTGTGATAQIVTSGGAVTWVALKDPGQNYTAGDVLTIPGGTGTITVLAVVPKNDASGHFTAQRIGAGTTQPRAGIDSRFGASVSGFQTHVVDFRFNSPATFQAVTLNRVSGAPPTTTSASYAITNAVDIDLSAFTGTTSVAGINQFINPTASAGSATINFTGVNSQCTRSYAADTNTSTFLRGGTFAVFLVNNAYTTQLLHGVAGQVQTFNGASGTVVASYAVNAISSFASPVTVTDHASYDSSINTVSTGAVIVNLYGVRLRAYTFTAPSVVPTNYYPHSQEDTRGRNYFRSPTFFGSAVGTARSATNPSVEVEAVSGVSNGDVRLRSASAVFDASNSSTNGVRYFARTSGTDLPVTTTQSWYEEGTYTPAGNVNFTLGTCTGTWTRIGRKVFVTLNFAAGVNNGSTVAGASSLGLPNGLAPVRSGLGLRAQVTGAASGNGLVAVNAATGLIEISTTVTLDTNAKVIQCEYEV